MFLKKIRLLLVVCTALVPAGVLRANLEYKSIETEEPAHKLKSSSTKSIDIKFGNSFDTKSGAEKTALACGYITSLAIISRFIEQPTGLWEFFWKAFCVSLTVGFTGKLISELYHPVFAMLFHPFSDNCNQEILIHDNLAILIAQWHKVKKDVPAPLRDKLDRFCQDYEKNGQPEITEEQALALVKEMTEEINRIYALANQESVNAVA